MLDISKLQKKENLAKEMIKLGVAGDIQNAFQQIEDNKLVNANDDFNISEIPKKPETAVQASQPVSDDLSQRLEKIEQKIKALAEFVDKYREQNDKNLKEVDTHIKGIHSKINDIRTRPVEQKKDEVKIEPAAAPAQKEEMQAVTKPKEGWDTSQFAVENVFNNSGNRLTRK